MGGWFRTRDTPRVKASALPLSSAPGAHDSLTRRILPAAVLYLEQMLPRWNGRAEVAPLGGLLRVGFIDWPRGLRALHEGALGNGAHRPPELVEAGVHFRARAAVINDFWLGVASARTATYPKRCRSQLGGVAAPPNIWSVVSQVALPQTGRASSE